MEEIVNKTSITRLNSKNEGETFYVELSRDRKTGKLIKCIIHLGREFMVFEEDCDLKVLNGIFK